jgi:8-oxo-dGTP diphosphatase
VAVFALVTGADGRLLLLRRAGSGYRDGQLAPPAGHLEAGEDLVSGVLRELAEEVGLTGDPARCRLATVVHSAPEYAGDEEYLNFFFAVDGWTGTPEIREPEHCTELVWADPADVPADTVDYLPGVLAGIAAGAPLQLANWPQPPAAAPSGVEPG